MPVGTLNLPAVGTPVLTSNVLGGLQQFTFGGVAFPCFQTSLELRQDLTIHKFADRDGAHVEGCGRHPVEVTARIPFFNGLIPGSQETWNSLELYPNTWRLFFLQALDRASKTLQHPELGPLTVKLQSCKTDWTADTRNGVWVDAKWLETDDSATELTNAIASFGANASALSAANDLDTNMTDPTVMQKYGIPPTVTSFTQLVQNAQAAVNTATFVANYTQSQITAAIAQATSLESQVANATRGPYPQALLWPLTQSAEQLKASAYVMQAQMLQRQPAVAQFTTKTDATLARISNQLGVPIDDLIQLNVPLVPLGFVPAGTVVKYFQKAA